MNRDKPYNQLELQASNRQILKIALPISLAMLVPQVNFLVNNVFISRLGEMQLATAGITGVFYLIFALTGNGLNSGIQGLLARRAGENRPEEIGRLFIQGIWVALFFAAAGMLITYTAGQWVLAASIKDQLLYHKATGFLKIRIWGLPFLYCFQVCNALLVGTNNSRYMKFGFWIQAGVNILLDYLLIFGHWGFPDLGFDGAAYASVIAECGGMLIVTGIILFKKFHHRFSFLTYRRFDPAVSGLIFRQSSPLVGQYLLSILSWFLFYILIEHMDGDRPLAISQAMRTIFGFFGIFCWAFASTANAMVSNIIGQGKKEQVVMLIKRIMTLSFLFTFTLCVIANLFPDVFLHIFIKDKGFVHEAIPVIRIVTGGLLLMSMATVWLNAVTGTGNTKINLLIEIAAITVYTIYIWMALKVWKLGLVWAWAAELIYWFSLLVLSFVYIRSGRWKNKVI